MLSRELECVGNSRLNRVLVQNANEFFQVDGFSSDGPVYVVGVAGYLWR